MLVFHQSGLINPMYLKDGELKHSRNSLKESKLSTCMSIK